MTVRSLFGLPTLIVTVFVTGVATSAYGQHRDLRSDLKEFNVRHTTEHYALAGTVSDTKLAHYGEALEYVYREYARGFGELLDSQGGRSNRKDTNDKADLNERFRVVILEKPSEYEEFARAYFQDGAEHTSGMFASSVGLLIIRHGGDADDTYGTLFHEAFHQFARRYIPHIPIWINEGLATYYGTGRPGSSGLVFNRPRSDLFRVVGNAVTHRKLIPLHELLLSSKASFYSQKPIEGLGYRRKRLCYAQAYTLVSYMINDAQGREHLRTYLQKLAEAKNAADVRQITSEMFSERLLDAMVEPWLEYVRPR